MEFEDAPETLGSVIRAARKTKRLSQGDLGDQLGVSQPSVSAWEAGRSLPTIQLLVALARVLDLDASRLLTLAAAEAGNPTEEVACG